MNKRIGISDIVLLLLSVIMLVGVLTAFSPCDAKEDGSWMTCHWAGMTVAGISAVLTVQALLHLLFGDPKVKSGLSMAMAPTAILAAITPGVLINLCMMKTMHCHAVMRPAVIVLSSVIVIVALIDAFIQRKKA